MPLPQGEALNQACEGQPALLRNMLAGLVPVVRKVNVGTLASVAASTTAEQSVTIPGLAVGDFVYVTKPTVQAGLGIVGARVVSANTLGILFGNPSIGAIVPTASEIYLVLHAPLTAP